MFDFLQTKDELKNYIRDHKPHLILLDLRLIDEEGKQDLADLGGYQLLRFIKQEPDYKGVPVIVFTASSKAEAMKKLIEIGAAAVWTKPGLDEDLNTEQVIERYEKLLYDVHGLLNRFAEPIKLESDQDVEDSRLKVLQKIEFLKYRARLSDLKTSSHYFNEFTDIFIDTNIVIDSANSICNVYKLAQICSTTKHVVSVEGTDFELFPPKVVLINFVVDEIIHWSKQVDLEKRNFWKLGLLAYDVVRGLFQDTLVRTEFNTFKEDSDIPEGGLTRTGLSAHADPKLIVDITRIVSGAPFELVRHFRNDRMQGRDKWDQEVKTAAYKTTNSKVLLITNEGKNVADKIPMRLMTRVKGNNPLGTVEIISLAEFSREIEPIRL